MEIGPHVFEKSGRQSPRQTDTATLYILMSTAFLNFVNRRLEQQILGLYT